MSQTQFDRDPIKEEHLENNTYWYICLITILMIGYFLLSHQWGGAIFSSGLLVLLLSLKYLDNNTFTISISFFIIFPLSISFFTLLFLAFLVTLPPSFAYYYILLAIPVTSLVLLFLKRKDQEFLNKAKVSLEFNNCLFVIISLSLVIFAYEETNFKFLSPIINLENVARQGFQDRDAFNYLCQIFSFPFLVSTALCKWLLEWLLYRKELKVKSMRIR